VSGNDTAKLLASGVADAVGFVGGALLGFWLGQLLGLDIFAPGYGTGSLIGIALVGLGGGLGLHAARRWQAWRLNKTSTKE
jgi:hypothetical protein